MRHSAGNTRKGCYENIPSLQNFPPIQKNIAKSNTKHPIADNFSQGKNWTGKLAYQPTFYLIKRE